MKNMLMSLIKPKGKNATWLILLMLTGLAWFWTSDYLQVVRGYLDTEQLTLSLGNYKVTPFSAINTLLMVIIIFWTTAIVSDFSDKRISKIKKMRVANKAILQKALLGLQKIASNFVSGIILLLERSLKPGDLIELEDGTFGYVRKSSSRSTLIETIDGKEIIVPNEEFIIKQVVNWTLNNSKARITINVGVSYGCDIEQAHKFILEAANAHPRCIKDPAAVCFLDKFGDSSVDFILYFWVADVNDGFRNAKSEVLFSIWNKFKENDIEIPFPQRDLNIKNMESLKVTNDE